METTQARPSRERVPGWSRLLGNKRAIMQGCTVVMRRQLAYARVLARSFHQHHPGCGFSVLVLDRDANPGPTEPGGVEFLGLGDVGLPDGEAERLPMIYTPLDLVEVVKPFLLMHSAMVGADTAMLFAPEVEIFAPLTDLVERVRERHVLFSDDASLPMAISSHSRTPGLIAVASDNHPFLEGWMGLTLASIGDEDGDAPASAWFKSVANLAQHVLDDRGCNVGYWNLPGRHLTPLHDHYEIDGTALRFFNFRGYEPRKPHLLSRHQDNDPAILLSEHPQIARLCDAYRDQLLAAGHMEPSSDYSPFEGLPGGLKIDPLMKRIYRKGLEIFRAGAGPEPVSPFGIGGEREFLAWLNEPLTKGGPVVTRYMLGAYQERDDLGTVFPDPLGADAAGFHDWFLGFGRAELNTPIPLLPAAVKDSPIVPALVTAPQIDLTSKAAVNVAGYFRAELGIGQAARSLITGLDAADVPYNTVSYSATANRQDHLFTGHFAGGAVSDINIICVNANQLPAFAEKMGSKFLKGRYAIGVWFWEVEDLPREVHGAFEYVDEVWVASEFVKQTLMKVSPKPVFKFHLPIPKPQVNMSILRADLRLPEQFVFLFSFDFLSVLERKNPLALIEAFRRAFQPGEGPALIIKTINGDQRIIELEKLKYASAKHPDVIIADGYISSVEKDTMIARCDCYVSLHRSEGFGLTMAEAMALGKPVIATGYSGNMEFMTPENSYLCSYRRCEVGPEREPYPANSHWADPDVEEAAKLMRHVYDHPDERHARGLRAAADIAQFHSPAVTGARMLERIQTIRRRRGRLAGAPSAAILEDRLDAMEALLKEIRPPYNASV
ncbi:MAG: glycosyltransferase family 4 protein [Chthoniobacterales bacterium]